MHSKRELITYMGFAVFIAFIIFSAVILIKLASIEKGIVDIVKGYTYAAILVVALLADMIMQPVGPDIPLVAGILIGLNPFIALVFASAGSLAATVLGYYLGAAYGEAGFMRFYGFAKYDRWRRLYLKYGRLVVMVAALTPLPYVPVCWLSGIFRMNKAEFIVFSMGSRILRLAGVAFLTTRIVAM